MSVNKVQLKDGTILIDITDVGTNANNVAQGVKYIDNAGNKGVGTLVGGSGTSVGEFLSYDNTSLRYFMGSSVNLTGINTLNRTNFAEMFAQCHNLTSLDLSGLNTSHGDNFERMFENTFMLQGLDLRSFNTSNAQNMVRMFSCLGASVLSGDVIIDVSSFNTANVQDMTGMFFGSGVTSLDLSNFNTSNVYAMMEMFSDCRRLQSLVVPFNTSKCISFETMFQGCSSLSSLDLSTFDTSKGKCYGMFMAMSKLETIKLPARFDENGDDLGLDSYNTPMLTAIYVPNPALSYYTDNTAAEYNPYFTDDAWRTSKIVGYATPSTTYTFSTTGGSSVNPITTDGYLQEQVSTATDPSYELLGWYFDSAFTRKVKFPYLNTNENNTNITLYAKYGLPLPKSKTNAVDINLMQNPVDPVTYEIDDSYNTVGAGMYPDSPRVWFKITSNSSVNTIGLTNVTISGGELIYTLLDENDNIISEGSIWSNITLPNNDTVYYIAIGYAFDPGDSFATGFSLWYEQVQPELPVGIYTPLSGGVPTTVPVNDGMTTVTADGFYIDFNNGIVYCVVGGVVDPTDRGVTVIWYPSRSTYRIRYRDDQGRNKSLYTNDMTYTPYQYSGPVTPPTPAENGVYIFDAFGNSNPQVMIDGVSRTIDGFYYNNGSIIPFDRNVGVLWSSSFDSATTSYNNEKSSWEITFDNNIVYLFSSMTYKQELQWGIYTIMDGANAQTVTETIDGNTYTFNGIYVNGNAGENGIFLTLGRNIIYTPNLVTVAYWSATNDWVFTVNGQTYQSNNMMFDDYQAPSA